MTSFRPFLLPLCMLGLWTALAAGTLAALEDMARASASPARPKVSARRGAELVSVLPGRAPRQ